MQYVTRSGPTSQRPGVGAVHDVQVGTQLALWNAASACSYALFSGELDAAIVMVHPHSSVVVASQAPAVDVHRLAAFRAAARFAASVVQSAGAASPAASLASADASASGVIDQSRLHAAAPSDTSSAIEERTTRT